ncbi:MAG TPA: DUF3500 domain-containing protein [Vicinamibacterales bacterium]|nr:DUF3500 domain-containing protein [Vicinamibacterales bacterium]
MRKIISRRLAVAVVLAGVFVTFTRASERTGSAMATAATRFVQSLTPEQRQQAAFAFESDERLKWHFIPTDMFPRNGLTIKAMTPAQRALALELLKTGMSQRGYMTVTQIMDLENVLRDLEAAQRAAAPAGGRGRGEAMVRDPERYFFSVFGTPAPKGTWGWRVEGHHVSLHFTVVNGEFISGAPTFFGVNPAEVRSGPKTGQRILADNEDAARTLLMALDPPRRAKALIDTNAPGDILTMNQLPINPLAPAGLLAADMTAPQRDLLMKLITAYSSAMTDDVANDRMEKIRKAGIDKVAFVWAGDAERGKRHYYRVQGPTFLIEYDNTQNDANHIHSVWRDFDGDFGRDLLREHVAAVPH